MLTEMARIYAEFDVALGRLMQAGVIMLMPVEHRRENVGERW
jgi:hypothetical protein